MSKTIPRAYVSLSNQGLHVSREGEPDIVVTTIREFQERVPDQALDNLWSLGTVESPEDWTEDPDLLALCHWLQRTYGPC